MRPPPKKKSKPSDKPERELARGSAGARSAGEVTPGPQDRGEAKSGGEARRRGFAHGTPPRNQSPPKESSSGSDEASTAYGSKGSNRPYKGNSASSSEEGKDDPEDDADDPFSGDDDPFGGSEDDRKPPAVVFGPLHTGQGADDKIPRKSSEKAIKVPAPLLKEPPTAASEAYAEKATGNGRPDTPGSTPREQSRTQAGSPKPLPGIRNSEEQQVLDDVTADSEDDSGINRFMKDLRVTVQLSMLAVTDLFKNGLTSPLRLFQTAEAELNRLFDANPAITARDRSRLKCFRSLLLKELPSDLRNRVGIPTRELLEDALNQQAKQAQAATVAESTLRRDAFSEPPRDDRPIARMPDMYDGDPKKWHEFKKPPSQRT